MKNATNSPHAARKRGKRPFCVSRERTTSASWFWTSGREVVPMLSSQSASCNAHALAGWTSKWWTSLGPHLPLLAVWRRGRGGQMVCSKAFTLLWDWDVPRSHIWACEPARAPEPTSWGQAWGILFLRSWIQTTRGYRWQTNLERPCGHNILSPLGPWCILSYPESPNLSLHLHHLCPCDCIWAELMKCLQLYSRVWKFHCSICLPLSFYSPC